MCQLVTPENFFEICLFSCLGLIVSETAIFFLHTQVKFFNNYLLDPKRPSLPEHPSNRPKPAPSPQPPQIVEQQADPYSNFISPAAMGGYGGPRPPVYRSGGGGEHLQVLFFRLWQSLRQFWLIDCHVVKAVTNQSDCASEYHSTGDSQFTSYNLSLMKTKNKKKH